MYSQSSIVKLLLVHFSDHHDMYMYYSKHVTVGIREYMKDDGVPRTSHVYQFLILRPQFAAAYVLPYQMVSH